jgi:hypothetical protein
VLLATFKCPAISVTPSPPAPEPPTRSSSDAARATD